DAGMDAQLNASLEDLAQFLNFTAARQQDGTVAILVNGSKPLLLGDHQYTLSASLASTPSAANPGGPPAVRLATSDGTDVTDQVTDGELSALLAVRNRILPSYLGDGSQPGDLNRLAKQI